MDYEDINRILTALTEQDQKQVEAWIEANICYFCPHKEEESEILV